MNLMRPILVAATLVSILAATQYARAQPDNNLPHLHRHATTERSWVANAYWLESETGVVLVDALFLSSDVDTLIASIRSTGKPLSGILLTHAHIDHFGGIPRLRKAFGNVPVYATQATAEAVKPLFDRINGKPWTIRFGDEFPTEAITPEHIVKSGQTIKIAGMQFTFRDLGPVETENNTIIENLDAGLLFTGDATVFAAAFYLGEGHSCDALRTLKALRESEDGERMAYSGHYAAMHFGTVLDDNIEQIRHLRAVMKEMFAEPTNRTPEGHLNEDARMRLVTNVTGYMRRYADYGLGTEGLASTLNLPGLEMEIQREIQSEKRCVEDEAKTHPSGPKGSD